MSSRPILLSIAVDDATLAAIEVATKGFELVKMAFDLEKMMEPISPEPDLIVVSATDVKTSLEVAQALSMTYAKKPLYLCCTMKTGFERKDFIKNGFTDAFLIPVDINSLKKAILETAALLGSSENIYRPVKLIDIEAGEAFDFDTSIFMPSNNKFVKISVAGTEIDASRLEKIKKNNINNLQVNIKQIDKFYSFTAQKLRKTGSSTTLSVTEKREKLTTSVRELMSGLFSAENTSFESGQDVMKNCSGIVSAYILEGSDSEWFKRIQQVLGEFGDHYSHSGNVSTLAALFSMGLGVGKPEDLALAGLLHDIGKAQLPIEIQTKESDELTKEEFELYKKHPELSVDVINHKKIIVPESVKKAILQHHELYNGTGFPKGFTGDRITKEAQILALADKFDHLTKLIPGRPLISPLAAVKLLRKEQIDDPSKIRYDPDLLKKLLTLFPE